MRLNLALLLLSQSAHGFATLPSRRVVPSVLSSAIEDADTAVAAAGVDDELDALLQKEGGDLEALLQEDGIFGEEVPEETTADDLEDTDVVGQFLAMMDDTPPGKLEEEELSLLRGTMQELAATPEKAEDVQKTLYRMLDEYEHAARTRDKERMEIVTPTPQDFELAAQAWTNTGDKGMYNKIASLFFEQDQFFRDARICAPSLTMVETAMHALAESRSRDADRKAYDIVQQLEDYLLTPTVNIYTSLIACLARSRQRGSADRAEKVLEEAIELFPPKIGSDGSNTGLAVEAFNVVMTAWAKSGRDYGPERAEKLLVRMDEADKAQGILKPTASSFTSLIDAHAQMNSWEGACQAERTLNALLDYYLDEDQDSTLEPNIATWGIVLSCWNRVSKKGSKDAASKAANLLSRMENLHGQGKLSFAPDAIAYVTVMNAWCSCKDISKGGAQHAEDLLDEMNEKYMDGADKFKPSAKSVRAVVETWIKSDKQEALFKAEEVFEKYDELDYLSDPIDEDVVKDINKNLLVGWTQKEDPFRAHEYLADMVEQGLHPDSFCYDRVIDAYNQDEDNTLGKVKEVFELLEQQAAAGHVKPNERVYTMFIRSLTKAKVPNLAQAAKTVLERMDASSEQGNNGMKPTVFTFNAVLKACSDDLPEGTTTNLEAFKVALSIFNELRTNPAHEPDHVTYGNMLRCSMLLPQGPQREAMIATTFQLCCRHGFVNEFVIRDLQAASTEELWRGLCNCPEGEMNTERLPKGWVKKYENKKSAGNDDKRSRKPFQGGGRKRF